MTVTTLAPVPIPTPYQSSQYGGNVAVPAGTQGAYASPRVPYYSNATYVGPGGNTTPPSSNSSSGSVLPARLTDEVANSQSDWKFIKLFGKYYLAVKNG